MKTSTDRILTTHTGSLPRPKPLIDLVLRREKGEAIAADVFEGLVVEVEPSFYPAIGNAALGDEAPKDLLQHPLKVHALAPVRGRSESACRHGEP